MHKKEDLLEKSIKVLNINPNLSFADICVEIGIARATAYKNFKDKDDLLIQIAHYVIDQKEILIDGIMNDTNLSDKEKLELFIKGIVNIIGNYYFLYNFTQVITDKNLLDRYYEQYSKIGYILKSIVDDGDLDVDLDINWSLYSLDGLFYAGWYGINDGFFGTKQIEKNIQTSFFNQIGLK